MRVRSHKEKVADFKFDKKTTFLRQIGIEEDGEGQLRDKLRTFLSSKTEERKISINCSIFISYSRHGYRNFHERLVGEPVIPKTKIRKIDHASPILYQS